jgi:MFS family permease
MGLLPDGERRGAADLADAAGGPGARRAEPEEFAAREALRTSTFWRLAAFHGLRNITHSGVSVHLMPLLVWKGLDEPTAAFFVGLTALSTVVVRPLTGWLGDHHSKQKIGALGVLLGAVGLVALVQSDGAFWPLVLFAVLFSFGDGINSVTWALVGDCFGRARFATIAVFTGWIYDRTESYTYALLTFIVCYAVAGALLWRLPRPRRSRGRRPSPA